MEHPDATEQRKDNAKVLLYHIEMLFDELGYEPPVSPNTGTQISGSKNGHGDGGFRLQSSTTGAPGSSHKEGQAVDIYDPQGDLDRMLTNSLLESFDLYREAPMSTPGWCHLTTRAPRSGRRTFVP